MCDVILVMHRRWVVIVVGIAVVLWSVLGPCAVRAFRGAGRVHLIVYGRLMPLEWDENDGHHPMYIIRLGQYSLGVDWPR